MRLGFRFRLGTRFGLRLGLRLRLWGSGLWLGLLFRLCGVVVEVRDKAISSQAVVEVDVSVELGNIFR